MSIAAFDSCHWFVAGAQTTMGPSTEQAIAMTTKDHSFRFRHPYRFFPAVPIIAIGVLFLMSFSTPFRGRRSRRNVLRYNVGGGAAMTDLPLVRA